MINYDIDKDLNIFLLFPDQATPLTFKNNLRIVLGSNPEKSKNMKARKRVRYPRRKVHIRQILHCRRFKQQHRINTWNQRISKKYLIKLR